MEFEIRKGQVRDLQEMKSIFVGAVSSICSSDYDESQISVWLKAADNDKRWVTIMQEQLVLVSVLNERIVGFASMTTQGHIDMLYVHKDWQRMGIASRLLERILSGSQKTGLEFVTAYVSKTAKCFFEAKGFVVVAVQQVQIDGVLLINYKMNNAKL